MIPLRDHVLMALRASDVPATPCAVTAATGRHPLAVRQMLIALHEEGTLNLVGRAYVLAPQAADPTGVGWDATTPVANAPGVA